MGKIVELIKGNPWVLIGGLALVAFLVLRSRMSGAAGSAPFTPAPQPMIVGGGSGGGGTLAPDPTAQAAAAEALYEQKTAFDMRTQLDYLGQASGIQNANAIAAADLNKRVQLDNLAIQQKSALDSYNFLFAPTTNTPAASYSGGFVVPQDTSNLPPTGTGVRTVRRNPVRPGALLDY